MKFVSLFRLNSPQMLVHTMESALKFFITVGIFSCLNGQGLAHNWRSMRAYGQVLGEWCDVIAELDCAMSGAECVPEPTGTGSVCKCKESAGYQKYGPDGGERCAPTKAVEFATDKSECQIDEDCQKFGPNAVCGPLNANFRGQCQCGPNYLPMTSPPADSPTQCRAYDCSVDSVGISCETNTQVQGSVCLTSKKCGCPTSKPIQVGSTCKALDELTCATDAECATIFSRLTCKSQKCVCPAGEQLTGPPDNRLECKANAIGSTCRTDGDCPKNGRCRVGSTQTTGRCICKDYHKLIAATSSCEMVVGTCCKNNADCGPLPIEVANKPKPLACAKITAGAATGGCICSSGYSWDPVSLSCISSTCSAAG